ncbi:MAG: hypothetical protein ABI256_02000 [Rhodoferax sp.]
MIDRRTFAVFPPAVAVGVSAASARPAPSELAAILSRRFGEIEAIMQGRFGVQSLDRAA